MIWMALDSAWRFVLSSASVATLIGCGAVAAAVFSENIIVKFAIPDLRKWAIVVAAVAFSYTFIAGKFYNDGLSVKQAQLEASLAREAENGEKARSDAERIIGPMPTDRSVFRDDPFNLDRGQPAGSK